MKKEVVVAVLIGLILGLIITYGYYRAQTASTFTQTPDLTATPEPTADTTQLGNLVLHSPQDETLTDNPDLQIAGTTDPNSFVVIFVNDDESITTADESGNFSLSAKLKQDANIISVYSIDEDGKTSSVERTVVYSDKPLLEPDSTATPAATPKTSPTPSPKAGAKATPKPSVKPSPSSAPKN
jgi:hypothetical protein